MTNRFYKLKYKNASAPVTLKGRRPPPAKCIVQTKHAANVSGEHRKNKLKVKKNIMNGIFVNNVTYLWRQ